MTKTTAKAGSSMRGYWWKVLLGGVVLWILTIYVTVQTSNTNLVPTIILLGSFLVPFVVVLYVGARQEATLSPVRLFSAFFIGGIFGVLGASLLEAEIGSSLVLFVLVGFIEEFIKLCVLFVAARGIANRTAGLGASLGAVVGAGFAAFESAGYAFNAALGQNSINLSGLVGTEVLRAGLSPVGHVLWTAILGATLFSMRRSRRPVLRLVLTFIGVALLHSMWDLLGPLSSFLALLFTGTFHFEVTNGYLPPAVAPEVMSISQILYYGGMLILSLIGINWLRVVLRHWRRSEAGLAGQSADQSVSGPGLPE
ncbi:MAG: PrsW family glutamic-type intramembrane protease [Micrococcaceae bacterium]|nr:PrsW family glutamic-type intramembrane protease [Micrococcaceae bacterium]